MTAKYASYLSPLIDARPQPAKGDFGLFANQLIPTDTLLILWSGRVVNGQELEQVPEELRRFSVQVEEDLYLYSPEPEPADYLNHSCDPNAGFSGQVGIVALRAIQPGEEICIDYAMCDGSPYDEFTCGCGNAQCRGQITGDDWRRPELQARYAGYFSPYLQRRIQRLQATR